MSMRARCVDTLRLLGAAATWRERRTMQSTCRLLMLA